jgi:glycosyltransferase involved in cell wall biosynthesis
LKIALITEYVALKDRPYFGGVDARTINFAKKLVEKNQNVTIISSYFEGMERFEDYDGVSIHRIGDARKFVQRGDFFQRIKFNKSVAAEIKKIGPDIVDASGFVSYNGSYIGARKIGVPVVVTVMEVWQGQWIRNMGLLNGFIGNILERYYLKRKFDGYIAISEFTKSKLIKDLSIPKEKIKVIYIGVDLKLFSNVLIESKYQNPTLITVSRLVKYKKIDVLLQAIATIKKTIPNINLKIVGTGPEEEHLKNLVVKLKITENVEFLGKISDIQQLIRVIKMSHIVVSASIVEGFGMVIIEAMACGIPYIASNIPAIREITNDGVGGVLFPPNKQECLEVTIKSLIDNKPLYDEKIKEINGFVNKYDWDKLSEELINYYKMIIQEKNQRLLG